MKLWFLEHAIWNILNANYLSQQKWRIYEKFWVWPKFWCRKSPAEHHLNILLQFSSHSLIQWYFSHLFHQLDYLDSVSIITVSPTKMDSPFTTRQTAVNFMKYSISWEKCVHFCRNCGKSCWFKYENVWLNRQRKDHSLQLCTVTCVRFDYCSAAHCFAPTFYGGRHPDMTFAVDWACWTNYLSIWGWLSVSATSEFNSYQFMEQDRSLSARLID